MVEREPYDLLFGERKAPDGTQLGRPPGDGRKAADLYAQLLAAEPHATAERKRELRTEAVKKARQSPLFFDLTMSLSKSISIFHASLGENARLARQAGDHDGDQYWSALVAEVDDMIWQAVHAGFDYFQREAGYTRTGSHGTRVHGRETGQWHEADLAVAHWLQHTSRDGDMQLHVHSQIAHVAKTSYRREMAGPGLAGLQRAHRRGRRDRLPAPGRGPHRPVRPGMDRARRRPRLRDQGHQRGDDARVLLPPRVDHGGPARPRGAVRAAVRPRAVPARARAPRAGVELHDAQPQARRAGSRAGARGLGGQARAHARRLAGVGRAVGLAWRRARRRARARPGFTGSGSRRTRAGPRGAEGGRAGAAGKERVDPRGPDQVPGPRPAPHRPGSGRGRRAAARTWPTGRWPRSSSRSPAWRHPNRPRCRPACCARTGAASTSGTAVPGMPRARSWPWKSAWSRRPARAARRA